MFEIVCCGVSGAMKKGFYVPAVVLLLAAGCTDLHVSRHPADLPVLYYNSQYNFTFWLPASWHSHSELIQQWEGDTHLPAEKERGPMIVLRHRHWKADDPYQDIPILVFSRKQWSGMHDGQFFVGVGGVWEEIGHNSHYVFGISSRFNANDAVKGWSEATDAVERNRAATPHLYPQ
jgi:hypothetical protein